MFKFLLKRRYGLSDSREFISFLFFVPFLILVSILLFFNNFFVENKSIVLIGCLTIYYIFYSSKKWIENYRKNTPYKIKSINENKKELQMFIYPTLDKIEFYYKGKLHREDKPAVVRNYTSKNNKEYDFFLFGKKYKNKEKFDKAKNIVLLQNQINTF
tara:strand:- start:2999 stop:3472 length:474 start_codon:yes stop_codon:yes gene_type:complete